MCPVETAAPLLPDDQQVTTSLHRPIKGECDVTLNDADISDSIARALLDAIQEKRTGNQLPATMMALARVGGAQLQPWLATGGNHQVRSSSLPKIHCEPYVRGYLKNQPSTAVPAQINSSRSCLTPTAEAETNVQADPLHGNCDNTVILVHSWRG